ncbi:amidohydrolase [Nocardia transvalensis]|uniref:amidohydrolase n=1 Tax=Nocardia transvalensis TaxID=37333 RepID=UPI0018952B8A|nr:amidohydrolase [Nocardia transvalensis]MBF6332801.1 amidohydrolase [Nocardia transvalensis]
MDIAEEWLLADSAWWGTRRRFGRCALRLRHGAPADATPVAPEDVPAGARVRRLRGTVLPGLRDAHVHCALVDLRSVRAGGIAEVHDLGSAPDVLEALPADDPTLPRMRVVGAFLTAPGGYPGDRSWAAAGSVREVRSPLDAEGAVGEQRQVGACAIKVALNSDAGPVLADSVLAAIVGAAHDAGLPVIAHVEGEGMTRLAYDNGIDRLAHTPWTERVDDGLVADAAQYMSWISTLDIHGFGTDTPQLRTATDNLRRFVEHGGTVLYGTDLGNGPLPPGVNTREVTALLAAGLTPDDVLTAMTDSRSPVPPCWVPGGLDSTPSRFAGSLGLAQVVDPVTQSDPRDTSRER